MALATRRMAPELVALGFHLAALIPLLIWVLAAGGITVDGGALAAFVGLGAVGWLSYLTFYTALSIGPISLVSPIVSGYAAFTVLFAVALGGERLAGIEGAAVGLTVAGVVLASTDAHTKAVAAVDARVVKGLGLGVIAMMLFGGFVYGVSYRRPRVGWLPALFLARAFSGLFLLCQVIARRRSIRRPSLTWNVAGIIVLIGFVDTAGYACFSIGVRHAQTAVVATASAPYALVPVVVGVKLLRERPSRAQWLGLAAVGSGLLLLGAAG